MGAVCCGVFAHQEPILSAEEKEQRRQIQIDATAARSKNFNQGGGGEKLKAKAKALDEYEKKNKDLGGPNTLKWNV